MSETAKWYVIHTYSGYENKVAQDIEKVAKNKNLENLIQEIKIPVETLQKIKNGKTKEVERKLFPSYIIIKMILTNESWYAIKNIRGVTNFVGPSSSPISLSQKEIESLNIEKSSTETDCKVGDRVKIISGSMKGFDGDICEINIEKKTAVVSIAIFGRNTDVEVSLNQIVLTSWLVLSYRIDNTKINKKCLFKSILN